MHLPSVSSWSQGEIGGYPDSLASDDNFGKVVAEAAKSELKLAPDRAGLARVREVGEEKTSPHLDFTNSIEASYDTQRQVGLVRSRRCSSRAADCYR